MSSRIGVGAGGELELLDAVSARFEERTTRGLARAVSVAVGEGVLAEGAKLPPIREVATALRVSPSTVSAAWALLARAGTIRSDGRRGTTVATRRGSGPSRYRRALDRTVAFRLDLSTGVPDPTLIPDLTPAFAQLSTAGTSNSYLDQPVLPELADVVLADWPYPTDTIAIMDGAMDAVDQVASFLLRFGDSVIVENPCFPPLLDLLEALGVRTIGVDVDGDGLVPEAFAQALATGPRAVFLQPRAHNPTGGSMSEDRATVLAATLAGTGTVIVEDDSTGAISATPPISIGTWLPEQTVHIRSFSKSHGPDLRLAALSAPNRILEPILERRLLGQGWTSRLLQRILLALLTDAGSQAQVARARDAYASRRVATVKAMSDHGVDVASRDGLNIWLPVRDETASMLSLASRGIGVAAGSPFETSLSATAHVRVTVGLISEDFGSIADALADASRIDPLRSPR
jgi:DNA-binding transcriptional MocR family regulator